MNNKPSAIGILFSKKRDAVLLVKRRDVPVWVLPGGGIEPCETSEEAVIREVKEETGMQVAVKRKVGTYLPINRLTRVTHLFECEYISGSFAIAKETKEVQFFPLNSLPKLLPPPHDSWIFEAAGNLDYIIERKLSEVTYKKLLKNFFIYPHLVLRFLLTRLGIYINT